MRLHCLAAALAAVFPFCGALAEEGQAAAPVKSLAWSPWRVAAPVRCRRRSPPPWKASAPA